MSRMLWFGLLIIVTFLFWNSAVVAGEDDVVRNEADTDDSLKTVKTRILYPQRVQAPLELPPVLRIEIDPPGEPQIIFSEMKEESPVGLNQGAADAVENMNQAAEDSSNKPPKLDVKDMKYFVPEVEAEEEEVNHVEDKADDISTDRRKSTDKADDNMIGGETDEKLEKKDNLTGDDKKLNDAIRNVELLHRSDRSEADGNGDKPKRRVYVKVFPPRKEFKLYEFEPEEETKQFAHEPVFIDPLSHAHVVHKNNHYARRVRDEM